MSRTRCLALSFLLACNRAPQGSDEGDPPVTGGESSGTSSGDATQGETAGATTEESGDTAAPDPPPPSGCSTLDGLMRILAVGDIDGDGADDLVLSRNTDEIAVHSHHLIWGPDWCAGEMDPLPGLEAVDSPTRRLYVLDLDDDGAAEIVGWARREVGGGHLFSIAGQADRNLIEADWIIASYSPGATDAAAFDIDGDGVRELILTDGGTNIFENNLVSAAYSAQWGLSLPQDIGPDFYCGVTGIEVGDFDGDELEDLFMIGAYPVCNGDQDGNFVTILPGASAPNFDYLQHPGSPGYGELVVADLDHDGWDDAWIEIGTAGLLRGTPDSLGSVELHGAEDFDPCLSDGLRTYGPADVTGSGQAQLFVRVHPESDPDCTDTVAGLVALELDPPSLGPVHAAGALGVFADPADNQGMDWVYVENDWDADVTQLYVQTFD